jgi:PAS domain S-box-containing protein
MTRFGLSGLRARLVFLVFLAMIPAFGLLLWTAIKHRSTDADRAQKDLLKLAQMVALDKERMIMGASQLLATLANDPEVKRGKVEELHRFFGDIVRRSSLYVNLGLINTNGDVLVSAVPTSGTVNLSDRPYFQGAIRTRQVTPGIYEIGRITPKPTVNFGYPVVDETSQVAAVLFVAVDLAKLDHFDSKIEAQLPRGSTIDKISNSGVVLLHTPDPEKWMGQRLNEQPLVKAVLSRREGTVESPGVDGIERFHAFAPVHSESSVEDIFVVIGVPKEVALGEAGRMLTRNLTWFALIAMLALAAAWFGGDFFVLRRINPLLSATERLSGGDLDARTGIRYGTGEMGQLARAFDQMAEALKQREAERQRAADALQASEAELRALVAAMTDVILIFDAQGRYLQIPPTNPALLYKPAEELVGKTLHEVFPEPQAGFFLDAIRSALETRKPVNIEYSLAIGEEERWFAGTISSMLDDKAVAVVRDITERKRAEQALKASEREKALILHSISEHLLYHDKDMRILWANRAAAESVGLAPGQLVGRYCYELRQKRSEPCEGCPVAESLQTGGPRESEMTFPDGTTLFVRGYPVRDSKGQITGVVQVSLDTTERSRARETLRRREEYFRSLIENTSDIILIQNANGTIRYISPAVEKVLGYKPRDLIGKRASEFIHPEDTQNLADILADIIQRPGETVVSDFRIRHRDGTWRTVEGVGKNLLNYPAVEGFVASLRDITERRQLEVQLRQSQRLQAVGKLAGGVAHDFNNLLTAITGYCDLLLNRAGPNSPLRKEILEIQKAGERASTLTHQLLAFSRKQVLQPKVLNLNTVVAEMHNMLRRLIGEDMDLATILSPDLGLVKADPGQIEQVIMNLAVNARDAMPQGGKLTIETANANLGEVYGHQHQAVQPGPYVMLAVSDTGCGMDTKTQSYIFEPFFTTKELGKGTGLGLSTVYGIVKQSGGYIWVYSELGRGTTFRIYLPRVEDTIAKPESTAVRAGPTRGTETILVVEDEDGVRGLVCEILRESGYTVLDVRHSTDALSLCEKHQGRIHLMITDVVMPGMGGRELAERLTHLRPELKVLYMSGYTENAIVHHGVLDEGTAFLQKPFMPDILARKVRDVLDAPIEGEGVAK